MNRLITGLIVAFAMIFCSAGLYAQGNEATIIGKVSEVNAGPIPGATVLVRNESTGFQAGTVTDMNGDYIIKQLPLGSPYSITVSFIGFGEQKKTGYALNQGDQLRLNFAMESSANELQAVDIKANSLKNTVVTLGASTPITAKDIAKLPVNGRNFTSLIDLSPLSNGSSLGGQLASSTNYTLDGMTSRGTIAGGSTQGAYSISMEAIREFKVVTNEYDVTMGRSGGGTISTVTKSGTNKLSGSAFTFMRTDWLSSGYDLRGNKRVQDFSTYQYGASLGGAIKKDKAHFFVAWDHQADSRPLYIANIQSPADEAANKVTQATLDQFSAIARDKYGVSNNPQFGAFGKKKGTDAIFAKIDWQLNSKNLLTLRNNMVIENDALSEGDNSGINAYESYIDRKRFDNSIMASLRTIVNPKITNELKLQHFYEDQAIIPSSELPSDGIPRAIVENVQSVAGSSTYNTSIQIGGQRFSPEWFKGTVVQLVDNFYYSTGKINFTFGLDLMYNRMKSRYGSEMNGRFYFTGLENFANQTPYRYAREINLLDDPSNVVNSLSTGVYAQMDTKLALGLEMMAGLRLDNTQYLNKANFSQVVFDELGLRTDNVINTTQLQPRVQFTWDVNEQSKDIVRFGAGVFGSALNPYSMINNMLFDGTRVASVEIQGDLVPKPNFPGYRADPSTAPGAELFNIQGIERLVTINTNSKDAKIPVVYKTNFSYNHFFSDRLRVGVSGYASWARNNYMYVDRNMVEDPFFRIAAEANRGVYVPANTITEKNGATNWLNSRKTKNVGRVLELNSEGKKNQYAVVIDGTYRYFKDGQITASYTWNDSKDNTSYNGNVANTATLDLMVADDPRDLSKMAYANNQFRSKIVFYGTAPSIYGVTIGLRYSGIGGTRYSMAVSGNMNGDFVSSNDLAYIYNPNSPETPEYIRKGIQTILDNPDAEQSIKDYIKRDMGKMAERNGGINDFYGVFDLRLAKRFKLFGDHGLEASVDIFNVANLLNHDWGVGKNLGKQNLYSIKSFDRAKEQFVYNIGAGTGVSSLNGNPYQIQLGLRYGF
ncbi:TonB-dependent receptor [Dyadobacter chenhuakuii]|uniref:Carboxypeptidase regulatory-like domain-containing protein n=1 Tax=Dyadobacter chenhuakuii TaxID=2909339 RepID=A0ABY4XPM2_9BACT|nr:carboxypeptidase regulatory-like domain-containing protein [Dyadobacter chenhuakuii]MCF2494742.1 carboxypeptidase regulatory-like domain-containing protein [Dyadobacter chenhuakuii]USJ31937.1 carboxypeptidase regulatory-like domain-containing protein [Dyadobacter chenhuakuii]